VPPDAQQTLGDRKLEEEQRCNEAEQRPEGGQALPGKSQLASEVEEAAEEQGFDDEACRSRKSKTRIDLYVWSRLSHTVRRSSW